MLTPRAGYFVPRAEGLEGYTLTPEDEESLIRKAANIGLSGLGIVGNLFGVPGSVALDALTWLPGGRQANPFDQLLPWNWASSEGRTSGRDLLSDYGLARPNVESGMAGWLSDPLEMGRDIGGFGVELVTDPLLPLSLGARAAGKGGRALQAAGLGEAAAFLAARKKGVPFGARGAEAIGRREAGLTTKVSDVLEGAAPEVRAKAYRYAAEQGFDLSKHLDEPTRALARYKLPFIDDILIGGTGPKAQAVARFMDRWSPNPFDIGSVWAKSKPGAALGGLLNARLLGKALPEVQAHAARKYRADELAQASGDEFGASLSQEALDFTAKHPEYDALSSGAATVMRADIEGMTFPNGAPIIDPTGIGRKIHAADQERRATLLDDGYAVGEVENYSTRQTMQKRDYDKAKSAMSGIFKTDAHRTEMLAGNPNGTVGLKGTHSWEEIITDPEVNRIITIGKEAKMAEKELQSRVEDHLWRNHFHPGKIEQQYHARDASGKIIFKNAKALSDAEIDEILAKGGKWNSDGHLKLPGVKETLKPETNDRLEEFSRWLIEHDEERIKGLFTESPIVSAARMETIKGFKQSAAQGARDFAHDFAKEPPKPVAKTVAEAPIDVEFTKTVGPRLIAQQDIGMFDPSSLSVAGPGEISRLPTDIGLPGTPSGEVVRQIKGVEKAEPGQMKLGDFFARQGLTEDRALIKFAEQSVPDIAKRRADEIAHVQSQYTGLSTVGGGSLTVPGAAIRQPDALARELKAIDKKYADQLREWRIDEDLADDYLAVPEQWRKPAVIEKALKVYDSYANLFKASVLSWPDTKLRDFAGGQIDAMQKGAWGVGSFFRAKNLLAGKKVVAGTLDIPGMREKLEAAGRPLTDAEATRMLKIEFAGLGPGKVRPYSEVSGGPKLEPGAPPNYAGGLPDVVDLLIGRTPTTMGGRIVDFGKTVAGMAPGTEPLRFNPLTKDFWTQFLNVRGVGERTETTLGYVKGMENIAKWTDNMNRLVPWLELRKQGVDAAEAMRRVNQWQVNYDPKTFTPSEQALKRFFPFYTFATRKAIDIGKTLTTEPGGRTAQTLRAIGAGRPSDTLLPEHIADTAAIPLPAADPESLRYLTGLGLMMEGPLGFVGAPRAAGLKVLSSLNPVLKAPLEWATNQAFFQKGPGGGRSLEDLDPTYGRLLSNIQERLTGIKQEQPVATPAWLEALLGNLPTSRIGTTLRQLSDTRKGEVVKALNLLTGVKISDVSPAAQEAPLREAIDRMEKALGGKAFTKVFIPESVKAAMSPTDRLNALKLEAMSNILARRAKERKKAKEQAR